MHLNKSKLLNKHAIVYVEVPGLMDLQNKGEYSYNYQMYNVVAHAYNFTLKTLTNVLGKYGELIKARYVRAVFKFTGVTKNIAITEDYFSTVVSYLKKSQNKSLQYEEKRNKKLFRYTKNVSKALLGRL